MKKTTIIFVAVLIIAICFSLVISGSGALNNNSENLPESEKLLLEKTTEKSNPLDHVIIYEQGHYTKILEENFNDKNSYLEAIRIKELYENMTEMQKEQMDELKNDKRAWAGNLWWKEMFILGEVDEDSTRLTYEDAIRILSENDTYDAVIEEIEKIQKYPDYAGGSGTSYSRYWLDGIGEFCLHIDVLYHDISIFDKREPNNTIFEIFFQGNVRIDSSNPDLEENSSADFANDDEIINVIEADWPFYKTAEEISQASSMIFLGKIVGISFEILDVTTGLPPTEETEIRQKQIYTIYEIEPISMYKGNSDGNIKIIVMGGPENRYTAEQKNLVNPEEEIYLTTLSGMPDLFVGDIYLFSVNKVYSINVLINIEQGIYSLDQSIVKYPQSPSPEEIISLFSNDKWNDLQQQYLQMK